MRWIPACLLAALCAACGSPSTPSSTPSSHQVVARVGNSTITADLFALRLRSTLTAVGGAGGPTDNPAMVGNVRASVLRSLLIDTVIAQEAQAAGVAATPADIQGQIDAAVAAAGGMSQLQGKLAALGGSIDQLRDAARSSINEQRLEDVFAHQRALEVEQALRDGQSFATVAAKYSDDTTTASKGGMLGPMTRTHLAAGDPAYSRAVLALAPGAHTDPPVRVPAGYDIVRVDAVTAAALTLRHVIIEAPDPYTVRERPQWFSVALFEALATDCAARQIAIYIGNVGDDPCAAAVATPSPPASTPSPTAAPTAP